MAGFIQYSIYSAVLLYAAGAASYWAAARATTGKSLRLAFLLAVLGFAGNLTALIFRALAASRLPLGNGYEFILIFTAITVGCYLMYQVFTGDQKSGAMVMLTAALLMLSVIIMAQGQFAEVSPLMPALKSPWLTVHVLTAATAYACFAVTACLAIRYLSVKGTDGREEYAYKFAAIGFVLLSLSIILGAIWAEQAWGSYWSWDPKEVWALLTWIIYAIYLHLYRSHQLNPHTLNTLLVIGFVLVLFTFFGVNYLLPGMHSYAGSMDNQGILLASFGR